MSCSQLLFSDLLGHDGGFGFSLARTCIRIHSRKSLFIFLPCAEISEEQLTNNLEIHNYRAQTSYNCQHTIVVSPLLVQ